MDDQKPNLQKIFGKEKKPIKPIRIIFFIFLILLLLLLFFAVKGESKNVTGRSITGNVIGVDSEGSLEGIELQSRVSVPEVFEIDSQVDEVELRIKGSGNLYVGKQKFGLSELKSITDLVLKDFDGEIVFNKDQILSLEGKALKIFINNVPIDSESNSKMKIRFDKSQVYNYMKLNNFYLNSLSYNATGEVRLNNDKVVINLKDEDFEIKKFQGDLVVSQKMLIFDGIARSSSVQGVVNMGFG